MRLYKHFGKNIKPYNADGYLDGLSVTSKDALESIKELKQKHKGERVLLLLDPPYLQTSVCGFALVCLVRIDLICLLLIYSNGCCGRDVSV